MTVLALIIRFLFFGVFFLAGASAMVLSIIAEPELTEYYESRRALIEIEQQNKTIQDLTDKYSAQIALIESEPNILERFIPLTFGQKPKEPDTAYPQSHNPVLKAETEKLLERIEKTPELEPTPAWLERVIEPGTRRGLFGAGAGLTIVTFIFFGLNKEQ